MILKIHGAVDRSRARPRQLRDHRGPLHRLPDQDRLGQLLPAELCQPDTSHFLFLGYSMQDWNLRVILHRIWGQQPLAYKSWAIQLDPSELEQEFWEIARRGGARHPTRGLRDGARARSSTRPRAPSVDRARGPARDPVRRSRRRSTRATRRSSSGARRERRLHRGEPPRVAADAPLRRRAASARARSCGQASSPTSGAAPVDRRARARARVGDRRLSRLARRPAQRARGRDRGCSPRSARRARARPAAVHAAAGRLLADRIRCSTSRPPRTRRAVTSAAERAADRARPVRGVLPLPPRRGRRGHARRRAPARRQREDLRANFLISIREDAYTQLDRFEGRIRNLFGIDLRIEHLDEPAARAGDRRRRSSAGTSSCPTATAATRSSPSSWRPCSTQVRAGAIALGQTGGGTVDDGRRRRRAHRDAVPAARDDAPVGGGASSGLADAARRHARAARRRGADRPHAPRRRARACSTSASATSRRRLPPARDAVGHEDRAHGRRSRGAMRTRPSAELVPVLETLAAARILRPVDPAPGTTSPRFEIFHDVLGPAILDWRAAHERERAAREEAARLRRVRRRFAAGALVMLLLVLVFAGLAVWAVGQKRTAEEAADHAGSRSRVPPRAGRSAIGPGGPHSQAPRPIAFRRRSRRRAFARRTCSRTPLCRGPCWPL